MGKNYDEVSEYALVQAIINDESDKMYQLAKKLMIDISSVETMWLLPIWQQGQEIHAIQQDLKDFLRYYYQTTIVQQTENYLIVLLGNYLHKQPEATISKEYLQATDYQDYLGEIILCPKVRNTTEVRVSYQTANQVAPFLKRVYPQKKSVINRGNSYSSTNDDVSPSRRRSNPTTLSSYPTSLKRIRAVNDIRNVFTRCK